MNEFRQALDAFLAGRIDLEALVRALRAALDRQPHLAPAHGALIEGMARSGRLRPEAHARLTQVLRAPAPGGAQKPAVPPVPPAPTAPAAGPPQPPMPSGSAPAVSGPTDRTAFRPPTGAAAPPTPSVAAPPGPQAPPDKTVFRTAAAPSNPTPASMEPPAAPTGTDKTTFRPTPGSASNTPPRPSPPASGGASDRTQFRMPRPPPVKAPAPGDVPAAAPSTPSPTLAATPQFSQSNAPAMPPAPPPAPIAPPSSAAPPTRPIAPLAPDPPAASEAGSDRTQLRSRAPPPAPAGGGSLADLVGGELAPIAAPPGEVLPSSSPDPEEAGQSSASSPRTTGPRIVNTTGPVLTTGPSLRTGATSGTSGISSASSASSWGSLAGRPGDDSVPIGPGSVLKERYVLEEIIGQGGMGMVFRARDSLAEEAQDRNPFVAVKILNEEFKRHPESLRALQRESRKAQNLAHQNVLTVYSFERDRGNVFMVMELLEGEPLDKFIKRNERGVSQKDALWIIRDLCAALSYAHQNGVVHSDFKPANAYVIKDQDGRTKVKVLDFGIARAAKIKSGVASAVTLFDAGTLGALTPGYASYEMHEGMDPDPRDDIYALACVFYELLTGRHPFMKGADNRPADLKGGEEVWDKLKGGEKIPADWARTWGMVPAPVPGLRRAQWRGILHGLAFRREDRTPTAAQFLEEITPRKRPIGLWIAGAAAVVLLATATALFLPGYLEKRHTIEIQTALRHADPAAMPKALAEFDALPEETRATILADKEASDAVVGYYDQRARELTNEGKGRYEYEQAFALLDHALKDFPDSRRLNNTRDTLSKSQKDKVVELGAKFDNDLNKNWLVERQNPGDNAMQVLAVLAKVQPDNGNLQSDKLRLQLSLQADGALQSANIALATDLIAAGTKQFPTDPEFKNLAAKLERTSESVRLASRARELSAGIGAALAKDPSLAAFDARRKDLLELRSVSAADGELIRFGGMLEQRLDRELSSLLARRSFADAGKLLDSYADLALPAYVAAKHAEIAAAQRGFEERLARLSSDLRAAIDAGRLAPPAPNNALAIYADLQKSGADAGALAEANDQIADGYRRAAREQRQKGAWADARQRVQAGLGLKPSQSLVDLLQSESKEIDNAEQAARANADARQRAALAEQKKKEDDQLTAQLDAALKQPSVTVEGARTLLQLAQKLQDRGVKEPLVLEAPKTIAALLDKQIQAVYDKSGLKAATDYAERAKGLTDLDAKVFEARIEGLRANTDKQLAEQRAKTVAQLKAKIDAAVQTTRPDERWNRDLRDQLQQLDTLTPGDPYLASARDRAAATALATARAARTKGSLDEAATWLKVAESYAPKLAALDVERKALEDARAEQQQKLKGSIEAADIKSHEQKLRDEASAAEVASAMTELRALAARLPANDPFLKVDGPRAIAVAFQQLGLKKLRDGDYSGAIGFIRSGLDLSPPEPELTRLRKLADTYAQVQRYADALASASPNSVSTDALKKFLHAQLDDALGRQDAGLVRDHLSDLLTRRAARETDPLVAGNYRSWQQRIFGGEGIAGTAATVGTTTSPGVFRDPALSGPVAAVPNPAPGPGNTTPAAGAGTSGTAPNGSQTTGTGAPGAGSGANTVVANLTAGSKPCGESLAGYGRQGRGVCYDGLPNHESGPDLVVVPAGGALATALAVMRYEVTGKEFANFCARSGKCSRPPSDAGARPVVNISRSDAEEYARWLSSATGHRYRLPTDAEWSYLASPPGDTTRSDPNCDTEINGRNIKSGTLEDVNSGNANKWGLFNMIGNAQEWALGPSGLVARGGSYKDKLSSCTPTFGVAHDGKPDPYTGFRLVREL